MAQALQLDTTLTETDFSRLIRNEQNPRVRQRLIGLRYILLGHTASAAAKTLGWTPPAMTHWVHRFNAEGVEGLFDRPRSGRPHQLTEEQKQSLKTRIEAGPTEADGVVRFRWKEFQTILTNEYGAVYSHPHSVLRVVHSLGISWMTPRQIHPKSDEAKKVEFKKNAT